MRSRSSPRAGALEDFTSSGDDIDRQLAEISQGSQVDDELAKMKAELGQGEAPKQLEGGEAPETTEAPT